MNIINDETLINTIKEEFKEFTLVIEEDIIRIISSEKENVLFTENEFQFLTILSEKYPFCVNIKCINSNVEFQLFYIEEE